MRSGRQRIHDGGLCIAQNHNFPRIIYDIILRVKYAFAIPWSPTNMTIEFIIGRIYFTLSPPPREPAKIIKRDGEINHFRAIGTVRER